MRMKPLGSGIGALLFNVFPFNYPPAISKAVYFEVIETGISFLISPHNRGWKHYLKAQFSFVYRR